MNLPLNLLVIEDCLDDFLLIRDHLRAEELELCCEWLEEPGGLAEVLLSRPWDAVISGYTLPGMAFGDLLGLLQKNWPELPVILVSGSIGEEAAIDLLRCGLWDFVLKDRPGRLVPALQRCLEQAATGRARREAEQALSESLEKMRILSEHLAWQQDHQRLAATVFASIQEGVSLADAQGNVIAVNPAFTRITEYTEAEIVGQNLRMLQSGRHGRAFYRNMWETVRREGCWRGEVWDRRKSGEIFPAWLAISAVRDEAGEAVNYVGVFTDISRIDHAKTHLEHLAHYDALTDLPNRVLLQSRLTHALDRVRRSGGQGAVLFIDLDRFKNVNDSLGHQAGDELLKFVARRLEKRLREVDTVARVGGDEFLVVLEHMGTPEDAAGVARDLIALLGGAFHLPGGYTVYIGASIGISLFPVHGDEAEQLIQYADTALYQAKSRGRGTFQFYSEEQTEEAMKLLSLEASLRSALENGEFVLHYQPLVTLEDGRIYGMEALVRWQDPVMGLVLPEGFIGLAEETGLIVELGDWVLREACRQMGAWIDAGLPLRCLAVNLSPRQFRAPDMVSKIRQLLVESGLPAHYLELEITEGSLMEAGFEAESKLEALNAMGIGLSIDDFGTGYSNLGYLKRFPIQTLKIDRSFVLNIPEDSADMEIATTIVAMSRNLKLRSLAEGVETREQADFLRRQGCRFGQGYLFSPPVPALEAAALVRGMSPVAVAA